MSQWPKFLRLPLKTRGSLGIKQPVIVETASNGAKGWVSREQPASIFRVVQMTQLFEGTIDMAMDIMSMPESAMRAVRESTQRRGTVTREEAEFLFVLDRMGNVSGNDWFAIAVKAVRDFVVWDSRPTGHVTETDVDWLVGLVGDQPTAFGRAVVFAVVREAETVPPRLSELAMRAAVGRCLLV
jgi:hypothetical protein